jgi:hypothetical protein
MATVSRPSTNQVSVEVFEITLDEDESRQLLADPEGFTQQLLGADHVINGVHLSKEIADGATCSSRTMWHVIEPGPYYSNHYWTCVPPT